MSRQKENQTRDTVALGSRVVLATPRGPLPARQRTLKGTDGNRDGEWILRSSVSGFKSHDGNNGREPERRISVRPKRKFLPRPLVIKRAELALRDPISWPATVQQREAAVVLPRRKVERIKAEGVSSRQPMSRLVRPETNHQPVAALEKRNFWQELFGLRTGLLKKEEKPRIASHLLVSLPEWVKKGKEEAVPTGETEQKRRLLVVKDKKGKQMVDSGRERDISAITMAERKVRTPPRASLFRKRKNNPELVDRPVELQVKTQDTTRGRRVTRRSFLWKLSTAAVGVLATACVHQTEEPVETSRAAASATPKKKPEATLSPVVAAIKTPTGEQQPTPKTTSIPTVVQKEPITTRASAEITVPPTPSPEQIEKTRVEQEKLRQEQERATRLNLSPQLKWLNQEIVDSMLAENEETRRSIDDQVNALRLCSAKWVAKKEFGVSGTTMDKAGSIYFKRTDGGILVALQLVDKEGTGDYASGGLILGLDSTRSAELSRLITIAYEKADQLPVEQRPQPTFVTFKVDGLLGTDSEGKPIVADRLAWQTDQGTFVALRKEMMVGWVNPRHIGKRAGSEQRELYPGWELTKQGKVAYLEQDPKKLTEGQRLQWQLFYESDNPKIVELKKQGATLNLKHQFFVSSVVEDKDGRAVAIWSDKRSNWLEARILPVEKDHQGLSLSCESSASAMIARYFTPTPPNGYQTWEKYFIGIKRDCNPNVGYRGAINGRVSTSCDAEAGLGYGVYAEPIAKRFEEAGFEVEAVYGVNPDWVKEQIGEGFPVMVWVSYHSNPKVEKYKDDQGREYTTVSGEHAMTVIGYWIDTYKEGEKTVQKTMFLVNDPGKGTQYSVAGFWNWRLFDNMAVVVRSYGDKWEQELAP